MTDPSNLIAFQGEAGANSDLACRDMFPGMVPLPCETFEDAFAAVQTGQAALAMIPIENSQAGRVADVHHLLPESGLFIIAEHFVPIHHQLMAVPGAKLSDLKVVHSHVQALGQCRETLRAMGLAAAAFPDTAGAARYVAGLKDPSQGALASALAAELYGLEILHRDAEDAHSNTTRFVVLARQPREPAAANGRAMMTFVFQVRNVPAALYKALGGFATNSVNMTKLESYYKDGNFTATMFYADIEGHPGLHNVQLALEELDFFTTEVKILGVYPRNPFRDRAV